MAGGKYSKRGFPDYAKRFREKTGTNLCDLLNKMSNDEIRREFQRNELNAPSEAFLKYFRELFEDPKKMADRINSEFEEFVTSKLGMGYINENNILNSIILIGFHGIKNSAKVTANQLLKAIEIKKKYESEGERDSGIEEMVNAIFKDQDKKEKDADKSENKG